MNATEIVRGNRAAGLLWAVLIVVGVALAYANSLHGPFVYDDVVSIPNNPTIHGIASSLHPPSGDGTTVEARPLLNLSLALNYAASGHDVGSYHLVNLLIHAGAALLLFGFGALALRLQQASVRFRAGAVPIAGAVALLWAVHPLQTESVTYVIQRAESLAGLFILGSLFSLARAGATARPGPWLTISVACVYLGLLVKELVIVALPLLWLFDVLFLSPTAVPGGFGTAAGAALKRHRTYYLALSAAVLILALVLAAAGGNRSGSIGLGIGVSPWAYLLTQGPALVTYLRLSLFPDPLVFDYGTFWVHSTLPVLPGALAGAAILGTTLVLLARRNPAGFLGAWFLSILAPTSLVPGTTEMIVEHRMYLPLAAVLTALVLWAARFIPRVVPLAAVLIAVLFGLGTHYRNRDYRSELALWSDTVAKQPANARAHNNLGLQLLRQGDLAGAVNHFREALALQPAFPDAEVNLAAALVREGRLADAIPHAEAAVASRPRDPQVHANLAVALIRLGQAQAAEKEYRTALALDPACAGAQSGLGAALAAQGRYREAVTADLAALRLNPIDAQVHDNLGNAYAHLGDHARAEAEYREAIRIDPASAEAQNNLGVTLAAARSLAAAVVCYQEAIRLNPLFAEAHNNLGVALAQLGRIPDAYREFAAAVRLNPGFTAAQENLTAARRQLGLTP
jgi:Flp pilus assembly protein TadD